MLRAAAIIPARDETASIAATVAAALDIPGVDLVIVVDDGSRDATAELAAGAGARVGVLMTVRLGQGLPAQGCLIRK